jgi:nitrogenase-stabilizing/protective protein
MAIIEDLKSLSSAEEVFAYLDVAYDPAVLNVSRLHILRLMGVLLRAQSAEPETSETELRKRLRGHLEQAYAELVDRGPMEHRLFKVHQDAVRPKPKSKPAAFVPLTAIAQPAASSAGEKA